ncbi:hypothetical protein [Halobacteriovorax sp.]|uniref:hypothetical protein n=1 Tax=Halobacteriovorax sp. TaxID=2020862 RepID=UPI003562FAB2
MKRFSFLLCLGLFAASSAHASMCSYEDNRVPSDENRVGRATARFNPTHTKRGKCTVALVGKTCFVTSGVCGQIAEYVEFKVPGSIDGIPQESEKNDFYYIDPNSVVYSGEITAKGGIGKHWGVGEFLVNQETKLYPGEAYGHFNFPEKKSKKGIDISVYQFGNTDNSRYGVTSGLEGPNPFGSELHYALSSTEAKLVKSGIFLLPGIMEHNGDTNTGSSGAPLIDKATDEVIGVNTHGGCDSTARGRKTNSATSLVGNKKFYKAVRRCLSREQMLIDIRDQLYNM